MGHSLDPLISFTGGEWSPDLDSRIDLPGYRKAMRKGRNVIVQKTGGVTRRPGTQYIALGKVSISGNPSVSRMQKFQFAPGTSFALEFCDLGVRFYSNGAQVQASGVSAWVSGTSYPNGSFVTYLTGTYYLYNGPLTNSTTNPLADNTHWIAQTAYEVPMPYSATNFTAPNYWEADVFVLQCKTINDVIYIVHPSFPVWKLIRYSDTNWVSAEVQFITPAMLDENATDVSLTASATTGTGVEIDVNAPAWVTATYYQPGNAVNGPSGFSANIYQCTVIHTSGVFADDLAAGYWVGVGYFLPQHVGSYWQLAYNRPASLVDQGITGNLTSDTLQLVGTWEVLTFGTWNGTITLQVSYDNGSTWQVIATLTSASDANYNITGQELNGGLYRLVITDWTSSTSATPPRVVLQADNQFVYGLVQITAVTDLYIATATVVVPLFSTGPTIYWSEGAWSDYRGYPQAITIFQERVWYAATSFEPQRIWATQTDDIENFALIDQSQATYGLAFDLNAPERGPIQWLAAQQGLFAGLAGAEWIISGGAQGVSISASAIQAVEQSSFGSYAGVPGLIIGNAAFYVQRKGTTFEQMLFSVFTNQYMSQDMQVLSQHMTSARVKQFDFQNQFQDQSIIWAVTGSGALVSMTYAMAQEVFGWTQHNTGNLIVGASALVNGQTYTVSYIGNTNWQAVGAPAQVTLGTTFEATGPGSGNGTATTAYDFGFLSVCVIYGGQGQDDEVWVSTQRQNDGTSLIERINPADWQTADLGQPDLSQAVYADCSISVTSPSTNKISGIPFNITNRPLCASINTTVNGVNGTFAVQGLISPDSGPDIQTVTIPNYVPQTGDVVVVGLPIPFYIQPMRLDAEPVSPGITKAISQLYLRLLNSVGGSWATSQGDSYPLPSYPIYQNSGNPPPFTASQPVDVECDVGFAMEYAKDSTVIIQGQDPLPFNLLGMAIKKDTGGKP